MSDRNFFFELLDEEREELRKKEELRKEELQREEKELLRRREEGFAQRQAYYKKQEEERRKKAKEEEERLKEEQTKNAWIPTAEELACDDDSETDSEWSDAEEWMDAVLLEQRAKKREERRRNQLREEALEFLKEKEKYEQMIAQEKSEREQAEKKTELDRLCSRYEQIKQKHEEKLRTDSEYKARYINSMQKMAPSTDTADTDRSMVEPAHPALWENQSRSAALETNASRGSIAPGAMRGIEEELEKAATVFTDKAQACFGDISFSVEDTCFANKALLMLIVGETKMTIKDIETSILDCSDRFADVVLSLFSQPTFLDRLARIERDRRTFQENVLQLSTAFSKKQTSSSSESPDEMSVRLYREFVRSLGHCVDETLMGLIGGDLSAYRFNARTVIMLLYQNASWGSEFWNTYGMSVEGAPTGKGSRFATSNRMLVWRPRAPTNQPWSVLTTSALNEFEERNGKKTLWGLPEIVQRETTYPACATNYPRRTRCVVELAPEIDPQYDNYYGEASDPLEFRPKEKTSRRHDFMHDLWMAFKSEKPVAFRRFLDYKSLGDGYYVQRPFTTMDSYLLWTVYALGMCQLDEVVRRLIDILLEGASTKKGCRIGGRVQKRNKPCKRVIFYQQAIDAYINKNADAINAYLVRFLERNQEALRVNNIDGAEGLAKLYRHAVLFSNRTKRTQKSAAFFRNCLDHRVYAFFVASQGDPEKEGQVDFNDFGNACDELLGYVLSTKINKELSTYRSSSAMGLQIPSLDVALLAMGHILFPGGLPSPLDYYAPLSGYITRTKEFFEKRYKDTCESLPDAGDHTRTFRASREPVKFRGEINIGVIYTHTNLSTTTLLKPNREFSDNARLHMHLLGGQRPSWGITTHRHTIKKDTNLGTLFGESHWTLRPICKEPSRYHNSRQLYPVGEYVWACYVGAVSEEWECWMYIDGRFFSTYPRYVRYTDRKEYANARFVRKILNNSYAQANLSLPHVPKNASMCPFWQLKTAKDVGPHTELLVYNPIAGKDNQEYFFRYGLSGGDRQLDGRQKMHFVRDCRSIGYLSPELFNRSIRLYGQHNEKEEQQKEQLKDETFLGSWLGQLDMEDDDRGSEENNKEPHATCSSFSQQRPLFKSNLIDVSEALRRSEAYLVNAK